MLIALLGTAPPARAASEASSTTRPISAIATIGGSNVGGSNQAAAAEAAQCGKPVSARVGAWFCVDDNATRAAAGRRAAPGASPQAVTQASGNGTYCMTSGCYDQYGVTSADYEQTGDWGWDGTTLGLAETYVEWTLNGAQNTAKPFEYHTSVPTKNVLFEGNLLYGGVGQLGTQVSGKIGTYAISSVPAWENVYWQPNGYKSYDSSKSCYSQLDGWTWSYGNYPGYWYVSVKSIVYCKSGSAYYFQGDNALPASPTKAGWSS